MFNSIIENIETMTFMHVLLCSITSMGLGILVSISHSYKNTYSKNFLLTLATLPLLVQSVIMLVNGNLGTGVAIMGAFGLIRFRSVAGGAREIGSVFWAMGIGLATGMGYLMYIIIFSLIVAVYVFILNNLNIKESMTKRQLRVSIPENLDYPDLFNDIFAKFSTDVSLDRVRTTDLGSLYELTYTLSLKDINKEKEMIDDMRCRNGNLPIISSKVAVSNDIL